MVIIVLLHESRIVGIAVLFAAEPGADFVCLLVNFQAPATINGFFTDRNALGLTLRKRQLHCLPYIIEPIDISAKCKL